MAISVSCHCGFRKQVPDDWQGIRVTCKCGRSFVVGGTGEIMEPPVVAPPVQQTSITAPHQPAVRSVSREMGEDAAIQVSAGKSQSSVAASYRSRHSPSQRLRTILLAAASLISLACVITLAVMIPKLFAVKANVASPLAAATYTEGTFSPGARDDPASTGAEASLDRPGSGTAPGSGRRNSPETNLENQEPARSGLSEATGELRTRIADVIELGPDDGLLLSGMFGNGYEQLELTVQQQSQIDDLVTRLRAEEKGLVTGEVELEQWYADGKKLGAELLAVLTDTQRKQLRELIEEEKIRQVRFDDYAARLRPELQIPKVVWKIERDGFRLAPIKTCSLTEPAQAGCWRSQAVSGVLVVGNPVDTQPGIDLLRIHDLISDRVLGTCEIPQEGISDVTIVSPDGQFLAVIRVGDDDKSAVEVWSTQSGKLLGSQSLPVDEKASPKSHYQLRDCTANLVFAISDSGYWIWDFRSGEAREVTFPDWMGGEIPVSTISPGGRYVVVAHHHAPVIDSEPYHFLELCVYELETGDLLGNQILAADYHEMRVGAMAWSYDGRDLALLWDVVQPEPKRMLLHLNAINGALIRTVDNLPAASEGYAGTHALQQRDLIWLPDKAGWIVNLQKLVESDSGAPIEIQLPKLQQATPPGPEDPETIVDAIAAGNGRLLLIIARHDQDASQSVQLKGRFIDLPRMGPFL